MFRREALKLGVVAVVGRFRPSRAQATVEYFSRFGVKPGPGAFFEHRVRRTATAHGGVVRVTRAGRFGGVAGGASRELAFIADVPERYPVERSWEDVSDAELGELARAIAARAGVPVTLTAEHGAVLVGDAAGRFFEDLRPMTELRVGRASASGRADIHFWSEERIERVVRDARAVDAPSAPAGEWPIVVAAGGAGTLLQSALARAAVGDRLGEITIVEDPSVHATRGALNVDDVGVVPHPAVLVDRGAVVRTAAFRRRSFEQQPRARLCSPTLCGGASDPQAIVASVARGIACDAIGADLSLEGAVWIENGKRRAPVRARLASDPAALLASIDLLASDVATDERILFDRDFPIGARSPTFRMRGAVR